MRWQWEIESGRELYLNEQTVVERRRTVGRKRIVYGKNALVKGRKGAVWVDRRGSASLPPLATVRRWEWASQGVLRNAPAAAAVEFISDLCVRSSLFARHCMSQAVAVCNFLCMGRVTVIPDCERAQGEIRLLTRSLLSRAFVPQANDHDWLTTSRDERTIYSLYLRDLETTEKKTFDFDCIDFDVF